MKDYLEIAGAVLLGILLMILGTAFYVCAVAIALSPFVLVAWLCVKLFTLSP